MELFILLTEEKVTPKSLLYWDILFLDFYHLKAAEKNSLLDFLKEMKQFTLIVIRQLSEASTHQIPWAVPSKKDQNPFKNPCSLKSFHFSWEVPLIHGIQKI